MSSPSNPYEITDSGVSDNFDTWIARDYIGDDLKTQLQQANVLIVPLEGFRDRDVIAFPVKTEELYRFLRERSPEGVTVDLCIEDDDYCELALHADLVVIGSFVMTAIILPVCVNLLIDYVKEKLSERTRDAHIKVSFTVVESDQSSRSLTYEGPPEHLGEVLKERNGDEHTKS